MNENSVLILIKSIKEKKIDKKIGDTFACHMSRWPSSTELCSLGSFA